MKIQKQFTPITVVLESEKDLVDFHNILCAAYREENKNRFPFCSAKESDIQYKIQYLIDKVCK